MIKGRPPRLPTIFQSYDAPLYFATLCTLHKQPFPSIEIVHKAFVEYARRAEQFHIAVGRYVIMPDHVHFFVHGGPEFVLSDWIKG